MYTPRHFKVEDKAQVFNFLKQNPFGILVTFANNQFQTTPLPFTINANLSIIEGHISLGNPQKNAIRSAERAILIIQGSHSYISPMWYDHENVPTYNYQVVKLEGTLSELKKEKLLDSLHALSSHFENSNSPKFSIDKLSKEFLQKELKGIVGFRMEVELIEASFKLSQNRKSNDFQNIIANLELKDDHNAKKIAKEMHKIAGKK